MDKKGALAFLFQQTIQNRGDAYKKTEGERRMKEQPSPANADEQGIVKGEGCTCKIEKQVLEGNLPIGYCLFPQCEMVGIKLKLYNFKSTLFPL